VIASVAPNVSCLNDVPLDRRTITQAKLNIDAKVRSNLLPWNGQFTPQLVHALLEAYATRGARVLDCFVGSGTVLAEAGGLGLSAIGTEINPAAFHLAQIYTYINAQQAEREVVLRELDDQLHGVFDSSPLFGVCAEDLSDHESVKRSLVATWRSEKRSLRRRLLEALIVLADFYRPGLTTNRIVAIWAKLRALIRELPFSAQKIEVANCDARRLPLPEGSIDLVLTSPPYINVFNYHQQYRASVERMGWDLLRVARSEIGSNRKHRGNRFLTVVQYCLDIADTLMELRRVCAPSARIVFVVGRESNVRKTPFYNGDIVTRLGTQCAGLAAEARQERVFRNKFGSMIYEDIIHFRRFAAPITTFVPPVDIAAGVLSAAQRVAPRESQYDLKAAIDQLPTVRPSPIYQPCASAERIIA